MESRFAAHTNWSSKRQHATDANRPGVEALASAGVAHPDAEAERQKVRSSTTADGAVRIGTVVIILLLVGLVFGGVWLYRATRGAPGSGAESATAPSSPLSDSTLSVLQKLDATVEVRFYSVLDPATAPESLTAFADHVGQLLDAYQQAAGGKLKVTRFTAQSHLHPNAAPFDGIQVFNLEKGEPSYLGVALEYKGKKETVSRLAPEWEQALEPDLTRALARLVDVSRPVPAPVAISQVNTAAVQEVRALIPDVTAVTVDAGKQILQAAALKEFTAAAKELETKLKEAQDRLSQVQNGGSEADRQAAIKQLQQLQGEQTEKLKQIAAKSQAQIQAFQQLKAAAP
jgi:hypothetical protein